ncbi:MAG: methionine--tRNA ligase [Gemmatimonadota bacterium]|nr:methionine--tRNA ligase [Gemmatimonadota bacterium]
MTERFFLTTPIYYASGEPHLGHAYTTLLADALARYHRQAGHAVLFLTGTDEHGQKMQEEAGRRGIAPLQLADDMAERFRAAWQDMDVSFDRFIRTTEPEHVAVVQAVYRRLYEKGDIYAADYQGWYCVHDERYWTEKDLGPDQTCPDCGRPVRQIQEKNWFFRMSAYQERLIRHIEENPDWIVPASRRNEVLGFLRSPLEDLSVSRPKTRLEWGITLPFDEAHVAYVWVDALFNYVTASGRIRPDAADGEQGFGETAHDSWWPCQLHIVGKDILTTHAVYWPTLLMAADLPLPLQILAHGWWVAGGRKMSKSLGNVIDPLQLRSAYGTDAVRWYLLREMPVGQDASFTEERFLMRYEELANVLGNLASRVTSMIERYRGGMVPDAPGRDLDEAVRDARVQVQAAYGSLRVHDALGAAMDLARTANVYVEERQPWAQAKAEDPAPLDETLATLYRSLVWLVALLEPVLPEKMSRLAGHLGLPAVPTLAEAGNDAPAGRTVRKGDPLFPKA